MRRKWLILTLFALALLAVFGNADGVNLAQRPQGPWVSLETEISSREVAVREGFLTTVSLRNEGSVAATADDVTVSLPAGIAYVGQAFGSDVAVAPEEGQSQLRWAGPFTVPAGAELTIRFWAVATDQTAPGPYSIKAEALSEDRTVSAAELSFSLTAATASEVPAIQPSGVEMAPLLPSELQVSKVADTDPVGRGSGLAYTVTFSNTGSSPVALNKITDLLPSPFQYIGLGVYSEIGEEPTEQVGSEIMWEWDQNPPEVPAGGTLILHYCVWVPHELPPNPTYTNTVTAYSGNEPIASTHEEVRIDMFRAYMPLLFRDYTFPYFDITKTAAPEVVIEDSPATERVVTYTVKLSNEGDDLGVLKNIEDTLPPGFKYLGTVSTLPSGVVPPNAGATGKIVWKGPITVAGHANLTLVYRAQAPNQGGTYPNSATATTLVGGPPKAPAVATVTVRPRIHFEDNFENGDDAWTPFTNYWRLNESQWFWDQGAGYNGSAGYTNWGNAGIDPARPDRGAHDSLSMYLGGESEQWTDYRFQARFNMRQGTQVGVWFRGTYRDVETRGQWVTGYYFAVRVRGGGNPDTAALMQLRTTEEHGDEQTPEYWYHFSNPMELVERDVQAGVEPGQWSTIKVEVEGNHIRCYLNNVLAIDHTDTTGSIFLTGSVGFFTYGKWPHEVIAHFDDVLVEPLN